MSTVAGNAVEPLYWFMLDPVTGHRIFQLSMTAKTELTAFLFQKDRKIPGMGVVAFLAIPLKKGLVQGVPLGGIRPLMTAETEFAIIHPVTKEIPDCAAMRLVAAAALPIDKRLMLAEPAHLVTGGFMTPEA